MHDNIKILKREFLAAKMELETSRVCDKISGTVATVAQSTLVTPSDTGLDEPRWWVFDSGEFV